MAVKYERATLHGTCIREVWSDASEEDTDLVVSTDPTAASAKALHAQDGPRELLQVTVQYSQTVTKTVSIVLDSHLGEDYDVTIDQIDLSNAAEGIVIFETPVPLFPGDRVVVTAPKGSDSDGVTSTVTITTETKTV